MGAKRVLVAVCLCLLLTGMRDPFQPLQDTCRISQLTEWRYKGAVMMGNVIGILRDATGKWHRVMAGETLPTGWRVVSVGQHELRIATGEDCTPSQWRWKREGTQDENMDSGSRIPHAASRQRAAIKSRLTHSG